MTRLKPTTRTPKKVPPAESKASDGASVLTPDEVRAMVAGAAYLRSEARGFAPGHELADWFAAEEEVKERLARAC